MSSINLKDSETWKVHGGKSWEAAMNAKPLKTAYELGDIIVEQAILLLACGNDALHLWRCLWVEREHQPAEFGSR